MGRNRGADLIFQLRRKGFALLTLLLAGSIPLSWVYAKGAFGQAAGAMSASGSPGSAELFEVALVPVPAYGHAPLEVAFTARVSGVRDTGGLTYRWNFGDGSAVAAPPQIVTHIYRQPGSYIVTTIVTTTDGRSATGSVGVLVAP